MTEKTSLRSGVNSTAVGASHKETMSWPVVLGLGSLALLWPLAELTGLSDALGQPTMALGLFGLVAVVWIGTVGFCRVPRPVLTLTVAGAVYGGILVVISFAFGTRPELGSVVAAGAALFEIARSALLGSIAGLIARALQKVLGRR
jgi:hypothetical protein